MDRTIEIRLAELKKPDRPIEAAIKISAAIIKTIRS
jgi:hypothetical protein